MRFDVFCATIATKAPADTAGFVITSSASGRFETLADAIASAQGRIEELMTERGFAFGYIVTPNETLRYSWNDAGQWVVKAVTI
jgi:hypothetical protein